MDLETFKKDVNAAIKRHALTQKKIGELVGREQSTISKYLTGERDINIKVFENICKIIGTPPYKYFLGNPLKQNLINSLSVIKEFLNSL